MIGKLKGRLAETSGNIGLLETSGGVFYEVYLSPSLIGKTSLHSLIEIYTYLQVRDDALVLFGFEEKKQYEFFKLLLTVPGVGPKTAFNVISFIALESLVSSVKKNDVNTLTQIPGLGRKTAMKIILELSTKLKSDFDMKNLEVSEEDKTVIEALVSLGYKTIEAKKILARLPKNLTIEEKIKEALKANKK
ncbi:Holliday junction branch migration protein RuvA [Patescibacteria group bacterium]|nr:Holliday junction branch migration protein RuvA [Patescibacteria group bacterium]